MDNKTQTKNKELPDWLLDRIVIDRPLRDWQQRYPYLRTYSVERQLRKIPRLIASEDYMEVCFRMLQQCCQKEAES